MDVTTQHVTMPSLLSVFFCCWIQTVTASSYVVGQQRAACTAPGIAIFSLKFETLWSSEQFPKQYPLFRPHAQWSRLVGRTHSPSYVLWRENVTSSPAVKLYVETGDTALLDRDRQGDRGVFDVFSGSNINSGVGATESRLFADAQHSQVSLISRIVPSPDWFVGADSLSLCSGGSWVREQDAVELRIWDAGTDKGFTFTSPNWAENPQLPISEITSSHPSNAASSFFYPGQEKLPPIARVTLKLVRISHESSNETGTFVVANELNSSNQNSNPDETGPGNGAPKANRESSSSIITERSDSNSNIVSSFPRQNTGQRRTRQSFFSFVDRLIDVEKESEVTEGNDVDMTSQTLNDGSYSLALTGDNQSTKEAPSGDSTTGVDTLSNKSPHMRRQQEHHGKGSSVSPAERRTTSSILYRTVTDVTPTVNAEPISQRGQSARNNGKRNQRAESRKQKKKQQKQKNPDRSGAKLKKRKKKDKNRRNTPVPVTTQPSIPTDVDCTVSSWGPWSSCSKTCGFGNRSRIRTVLEYPVGRGRNCPLLSEEEVCGSMRGCSWDHFSSRNWGLSGA